MGDDILDRWWKDLSPSQRDHARSLGAGAAMPEWMVASLTYADHPQAVALWREWAPDSRFPVPRDVADYVSERGPGWSD